jgi:geranylgeranyl diphosphate synthase type I
VDAFSQLQNFKIKLDQELEKFLDKKWQESGQIDLQARRLVAVISDLILRGGKRLRPAFVHFAYKACGGKKDKAALYTSQAIEFFHTMAIIHDDIIDQSSLRRGKPTAHRILGESGAILAGDLSFVFADEIFSTSPFKDRIIRKARKVYDSLRKEVIYGQYLDILAPKQKKVDENKIMKILKYKSGQYTIERPLHLGAALAEAPGKAFRVLSNYGLPLGMAFQIQDDILGMFGQEKEIGKPVDSDLKEGKKTLLIIKALEKLKGKEKRRFLSLLGDKHSRPHDLKWAREIIQKTGSLDYSRGLAENLIKKAKKAIKKFPFQKEGKSYLLGIADYILERSY